MVRNVAVALLVAPLVCGCGARRDPPGTALAEDDSEYVLTLLLDLSGSFQQLMAEDGKGYEFALQVVERYFRDRLGSNDKLIIAQISGHERALLWQGTPAQLRQDFPSATAFRNFLRQKSSASGSFVHGALAQTIEYVLSDAAVISQRAKSAVFVLSDMLDNSPDADASKQRALQHLKNYSRQGGTVGLYYVDQFLVPQWRQHLRDAGFKYCCVESEIVGRPNLPSFD